MQTSECPISPKSRSEVTGGDDSGDDSGEEEGEERRAEEEDEDDEGTTGSPVCCRIYLRNCVDKL